MTKILILITVLITTALGLVFLLRTHNQSSTPPIPVYSPTPSLIPNFPNQTPHASSAASKTIPSGYSTKALAQDFQRLTHLQSLSAADQAIRDKLTNSLDGNDNLIKQSDTYKINYVNPPNVFMIELLTNNVQGKLDAEGWLKQQGLSDQGVCNLPVKFYLSSEVKNYFQQNNLEFNPIPDGC